MKRIRIAAGVGGGAGAAPRAAAATSSTADSAGAGHANFIRRFLRPARRGVSQNRAKGSGLPQGSSRAPGDDEKSLARAAESAAQEITPEALDRQAARSEEGS